MKPGAAGKPGTVAPRDAMRGLKPAQVQQLQRALALLQTGERTLAGLLLLDLARNAPDHPEVLRARGMRHAAEAEWPQAVDCLARAHAQRPGDFQLLLQLARAQDEAEDPAGRLASLRAAAALAATGNDWFQLSTEHDRAGDLHGAYDCVQQAIAIAPDAPISLLQRARCATALGHGEQAAADCRTLIARNALVARAWFMLADLKVVRLSDAELALLEATAAAPPATMPAEERLYLLFALGKALEDAGRVADAFAALRRANDTASLARPWDTAAFQRIVDGVQAAAGADMRAAEGVQPGREVIFLVGLPRSGTTLVEQIISSHPQVEGASELPYLPRIIDAESRRRGKPFPDWVPSASDADWARMGQDYLRMSARWRSTKPIATDKLPENWLYASAALRMLPGARVIDCRRDPVETCWSCYKQLFGPGMVQFTYRFEHLAAYWHSYDGLCRFLAERLPGRFIVQRYEALVAEPEAQIRALLAACGLEFDPACMAFHTAQRAIRTPSALQVRKPLRQTSTPGARYGELLQPLRVLLAPSSATGPGG
jgi:tetratricopeptide (TPR) repeat protein